MARPAVSGIFQRGRLLTGFQIGRSTPCGGCRYDLRGLSYDGRCPECGKPVPDTLDPLILGHSFDSGVAELRQGLRLGTTSWMVYLSIAVACLSPVFALVLILVGPIMRLFAIRTFAGTKEALPGDWPIPLSLLCAMAVGSLITTGVLLAALVSGPGMTSATVAILFLVTISAEGYIWMSAMAKYANQLEFPLIGPIAKIARWCWLLLPTTVLILVVVAYLISNTYTPMLTLFFFVPCMVICVLVTAGVTQTFSDIILQFAIVRNEEGADEPILVDIRGHGADRVETPNSPPLEVAESSGEEIRVSESRVEHPKPKGKPRDDSNDPNNPTGVY
jgi:hypothetical protein